MSNNNGASADVEGLSSSYSGGDDCKMQELKDMKNTMAEILNLTRMQAANMASMQNEMRTQTTKIQTSTTLIIL